MFPLHLSFLVAGEAEGKGKEERREEKRKGSERKEGNKGRSRIIRIKKKDR